MPTIPTANTNPALSSPIQVTHDTDAVQPQAGMMLNTGLTATSLQGAHGQGGGVALPQSPSEAAGAGKRTRCPNPRAAPAPRATASSNSSHEHTDILILPKETFFIYFRDFFALQSKAECLRASSPFTNKRQNRTNPYIHRYPQHRGTGAQCMS